MSLNRQDKALREFKQIMADLVHLLRASAGTPLAYMCWVNNSRQQFVWETSSTTLSNVTFEDRVDFEHHFLNRYKHTEDLLILKVGDEVSADELTHYFGEVSVKSLIIVPFINKGETVALSVLESSDILDPGPLYQTILSYNNAMVNVLGTYLEVVDLHEQQNEWEEYESSLEKLNFRMHRVKILKIMLSEMQKYLPAGGISLLAHGMNTWSVVLNSEGAARSLPAGLKMDDKSIAAESLMKGEPYFTMHFNNSPKRVSAGEGMTSGASLVIPITVFDRRQAIVVAQDENPLSFKEATKHKLINLARVAGLSIQASLNKSNKDEDLLTQGFGAYVPELWELLLEQKLKEYTPGAHTETYLGLISPGDVPALRTKFGLEELQNIQSDFVRFLNPGMYGFSGLIGFNSDYVYVLVIEGKSESVVAEWMDKINSRLLHGLTLSNGHTINIDFRMGYTRVDDTSGGTYQLISKAKKAHAEAVNDKNKILVKI